MAANISFVRYTDKMRRSFGKVTVVVDNTTYHNFKCVRRYLEKNSNFIKLIFLQALAVPEFCRILVEKGKGDTAQNISAASEKLFQAEDHARARLV